MGEPTERSRTATDPTIQGPAGAPQATEPTLAAKPAEPPSMEPTLPAAAPPTRDLRSPAADDMKDLPEVEPYNYVLGFEVARGGMGRIVAARDRRLRRPVAVKELLNNDSADAQRFEREALITARLQHPSIVRIYEAGRWPGGGPFYAMQMVSGKSLHQVISEAPSLDARLALLPNVIAMVEALAYAHQQRIIHRDLKPSNVLVGAFGETVVIDWGLAKDLLDTTSPSLDVATGPYRKQSSSDLTHAGSVMGTPTYMPPEQGRGDPADERADVYALGAILYTVLAGRAPFQGRADEVLAKLIKTPPATLESVQPGIPEELLTIVRKAMAFDREQRYPTAKELADDLRRFQTGQLVASHRYTRRELMLRWLRRHRGAVATGAVAVGLAAIMSVLAIRSIISARDRADRQAHAAELARHDAEAERAKAVLRVDDLTLGQAAAALGRNPSQTVAWLKELSPVSSRWDEAAKLAAQASQRGISHVYRGHSDDVTKLVYAPDGRWLASGSDDHSIRLWDAAGKSRQLAGHTGAIEAIRFSADARWLASASVDQTIRVWDVDAGTSRVFAGHTNTVRDVAFSPDGKTLASGSKDGSVRLWDVATAQGHVLGEHKGPVRGIDFSPDGKLLASCGEDANLVLWDVATGKGRVLTGHTGIIRIVRFSPDGRTVATASEDHTVRLWDVTSGQARVLAGHDDLVRVLAFSPDGRWLVSGGGDTVVWKWEVASGTGTRLEAHHSGVKAVAWAADGKWMASGSVDGEIVLWPLSGGPPRVLLGHESQIKGVSFSPDGKWLASASDDDTVRVWPIVPEVPPSDPVQLRHWIDGATNVTIAR